MPKNDRPKLKKLREKLAKITRGHTTLALVVVGVAIVGTVLTVLSFADTPVVTSTSPNDVIVQYSMPHTLMPLSTNGLTPSIAPPFTLYGNGLLVCGHSSSMPFMATMPMTANTASAPTSRILTQTEVYSLISRIAATGFFSLNKEYYQSPVDSSQEMLRVSLTSGEHYVLYYRDVPMPVAYKATVAILQSTCSTVTTPYVSSQATVSAIANADPKGATVSDVSKLPTPAIVPVQSALTAANTSTTVTNVVQDATTGAREIATSYTANKSVAATTAPKASIPVAVKQTVIGTTAQDLTKSLNGTQHAFVSQAGKTYEVAADPLPPKINNPLKVDYSSIRTQAANKGLGNRIKNMLNPKAIAASPMPVRIVVMLASDGGDANAVLPMAQAVGQTQYNWYCGQVKGYCYNYQGVQVIRGSQTMAYYRTCHQTAAACNDPESDLVHDAFHNLINNIAAKDTQTVANYYTPTGNEILRGDVDTLVVTAFPVNDMQKSCGYGYIGLPLGVVDFTSGTNPKVQQSLYCRHGLVAAHETGHTFGLNHTGNGTLMDGPPYSATGAADCDIGNADPKIKVCTLDPEQANQLKVSRYFQPVNSLPAAGTAPSTLNIGANLNKAQYLLSPSRQCMAQFQNDGNLVVYNSGLKAVFASNTSSKAGDRLSFQTDGNLVIYTAANAALWNSASHNKGGTHLVMQDDCNLVLYTDANVAVWSSQAGPVGPQNLLPARGLAPTTLNAGQNMYPGNYLLSPNLQCEATLQTDGNFVVYGAQLQAYFYTNTAGKPTNRASMQTDGNFVIYANSGGVLWDSTSHNKGGNRLVMQDDCNLVLYNSGNNAVWSSKYGPVGPQNLLSTIGSAPSTLYAGQNLYLNQYLLSPGAQCQASLQADGNFVIYGAQLQVYFYTNTYGQPMNHLSMQTDNNFVFYANSGGRLWDPMLTGRGGNRLVMQDDCNLVLYNAANNPVWSSKTGYLPPNTLWGGENLFMGQYIRSPNGQYRAVLQTDGNFVVYNAANQALFNTRTQGHYDFLAMQGDGNLVVYDINYAVLFNANTWGVGGQRLVMQDDGNLVLYTAGNVPLWCSFYGRMY